MNGDVYIERGSEKLPVQINMALNSHDKIHTGTGSSVELSYDDSLANAMVRIEPDSRVVLERVTVLKDTALFMDRGSIMVKLKKLAKNSTFRVRTPVAICGARGTGFGVSLRSGHELITEYEDEVYVKCIGRNYEAMPGELSLSAGWKVSVDRFEEPLNVERLAPGEWSRWNDWMRVIAPSSQRLFFSEADLDGGRLNNGSVIDRGACAKIDNVVAGISASSGAGVLH